MFAHSYPPRNLHDYAPVLRAHKKKQVKSPLSDVLTEPFFNIFSLFYCVRSKQIVLDISFFFPHKGNFVLLYALTYYYKQIAAKSPCAWCIFMCNSKCILLWYKGFFFLLWSGCICVLWLTQTVPSSLKYVLLLLRRNLTTISRLMICWMSSDTDANKKTQGPWAAKPNNKTENKD